MHDDRIRWAPKVQPGKIWQLYQRDAQGLVDEELIDEVGMVLYARCHSILLVSRAQLECPRCGSLIGVGWRHSAEDVIACPAEGCAWRTTFDQYHRSWRHRDLMGANLIPALSAYLLEYPQAGPGRPRMMLIDRLIHAFHHSFKEDPSAPSRAAANNLIEGSHEQVVALLDRLAYGEGSTPGAREMHAEWREGVRTLYRLRRPGDRETRDGPGEEAHDRL